MSTAKAVLLWLTLALACFLPAAALPLAEPENCIWEISSIRYDAAITDTTGLGNRTETPTSNYDASPILAVFLKTAKLGK